MAKTVVTVTRIKIGPSPDDVFEAGIEMTAEQVSRFTKAQLRELYDAGAIELKDDETVADVVTEPETIDSVVPDVVVQSTDE